MTVWEYITEKLDEKEKLHFTLIDPAEQLSQRAGELAKTAKEAGTDAIMVGGSFSVKQEKLDETIKRIKERIKLPVILFPSSAKLLSSFADAVFFMSLLNSKDKKYIVREPAKGAPVIKEMRIEPIGMGYIVISPGMRVGKKGKAQLVKREDTKTAVEYALFAQYFGAKLVYLEAGSGSPKPVSNRMIKAVKKEINIPLIVGGGIRSISVTKEKIEAGADIIVTGNIGERDPKELMKIISAVKQFKK